MRLIAPNGVRVSVSDELGERLKARGYRAVQASMPAPVVPSPTPRRRRATKTTKDNETA